MLRPGPDPQEVPQTAVLCVVKKAKALQKDRRLVHRSQGYETSTEKGQVACAEYASKAAGTCDKNIHIPFHYCQLKTKLSILGLHLN